MNSSYDALATPPGSSPRPIDAMRTLRPPVAPPPEASNRKSNRWNNPTFDCDLTCVEGATKGPKASVFRASQFCMSLDISGTALMRIAGSYGRAGSVTWVTSSFRHGVGTGSVLTW